MDIEKVKRMHYDDGYVDAQGKTFTVATLRPSNNNNNNTSNIFKYLSRALTNFHVFVVLAVHR
uniref:Uncharacterized protein n=1 Tax=Onchocerca volvulus TaxID=6282 RepID=A0A8R1TVH7_ONCVO